MDPRHESYERERPPRGMLRSMARFLATALQRWSDRGAERLSEAGERVQDWSERGARRMSRTGREMGEAMQPPQRGRRHRRAGGREEERRGEMPWFEQPGPYAGRGPKGYRRPDERIAEDTCDVLAMGHVDPSEIEVSVEGGEVTLRGTIPDRESKRLAEDMVEWVHGVKDVHNELRVMQRMHPEHRAEPYAPYDEAGPRH